MSAIRVGLFVVLERVCISRFSGFSNMIIWRVWEWAGSRLGGITSMTSVQRNQCYCLLHSGLHSGTYVDD